MLGTIWFIVILSTTSTIPCPAFRRALRHEGHHHLRPWDLATPALPAAAGTMPQATTVALEKHNGKWGKHRDFTCKNMETGWFHKKQTEKWWFTWENADLNSKSEAIYPRTLGKHVHFTNKNLEDMRICTSKKLACLMEYFQSFRKNQQAQKSWRNILMFLY